MLGAGPRVVLIARDGYRERYISRQRGGWSKRQCLWSPAGEPGVGQDLGLDDGVVGRSSESASWHGAVLSDEALALGDYSSHSTRRSAGRLELKDSIGPEVSLVYWVGVGVAVQRDLGWERVLVLAKERNLLDDALHLARRDVVSFPFGLSDLATEFRERIVGSEVLAIEVDDADAGAGTHLRIDILHNWLIVVLEAAVEVAPGDAIRGDCEVDVAKEGVSTLCRRHWAPDLCLGYRDRFVHSVVEHAARIGVLTEARTRNYDVTTSSI